MTIDINTFYTFLCGATLLLSVLGMWLTTILPGIDRWSKRFFLGYFSSLMLCSLFALLETAVYLSSLPSPAMSFVLVLECLLLSLPLPMLTAYLLRCCGEDLRASRLLRVVLGTWTVYSLMAISSIMFNGVFCYVTPDKLYYRGPWYALGLLPMALIQLFNLAGTIRRRDRLSRKTFLSFLVAILPMTVTLILQLFIDVLPLMDFSVVISALSMYALIVSDQIEQDLRQQREIARQQLEIANQRASIMVLQMRPHFIYNTMTSIYCLCNQDPQLARQVVLDFTTYLRKNFTAVTSSTPIPFTSELDHTRAYLAVEQAQFEDSLFVDYDTPHTWFRVPPLTLQPIVENAVKHGRDPCAGPFHISISTRKTETGSEIVVADNGCGYDPVDDNEPHIALKNIRQRLEIMCGGSLTIAPNDGGGTVVTVTIPDATTE